MNAALLFSLLLIGGPLMGFLVIIGVCLPGILLALWHLLGERMHLKSEH
ncbi:hypothetical protein [Erwinia sorbitola]|uniref:YqaE/Pmp3 family membrane protein n=1 Tax=Erwinia sorbitola TaxID=2681984 RepID=A0A6I6ELP7_9GAMM|nr:hypothetical protein [Erwinia sorbitola]MTD26233.1 hypothetical protein [Erwinia sorbitola]QGU87236.1 hypothetical protein GN242_08440 [Erwinia sorbitola]